MWISDRSRRCQSEAPAADLGTVTLGEAAPGVYLDGERRWTAVYGPGGYRWRPGRGDQVLVLKAGGEKESPCIVGRRQEDTLEPGEVAISSEGERSAIRLRRDGKLALEGDVTINGVPLETMIGNIVSSFVAAPGE